MKKAFIFVLFIGAALCVFAQNGTIRELSGDVELKHAGAASFIPAAAGNALAQDTIVSTGFRSTAVIEVGSSTIAVRPLTRLTLAEISAGSGTESINMNLQAGRVRVDVKPPAGTRANFTVQSPSATASVRGTSFEFDTRRLNVIEGNVGFWGRRGVRMLVMAGSSSAVSDGGQAADPIQTLVESLTPSAPVGAGSSGESAPTSVSPLNTGDVSIGIDYGFESH